mmetsp:Transcript_10765/g.16517  ORF Transcript_10765/g.16517 Transcript_10765/m.16517 type:complete len:165 (+) Transcript_10765:141-635(+)|eukprot:CAMPEP_0178906424 /NCGR_PEP_ID=MMETSP0786-20121207/6818_1 /TAXON_ID=186022 /ORGANISM="Thalassionema frauenfeldii, Strain CCMP 1798" /LENGTH=164 /DNA_ID=CAMNT_0020578131 /DNA_START=130 /DNA_END=624 /DNA_ORIENTATION=-
MIDKKSAIDQSLKALNISDSASPQRCDVPMTVIRTYEIMSIKTEFWVQLFGDQIIFGVSQLGGRVGTMVLCQVEEQTPTYSKKNSFNVSTLLGGAGRDELLQVYARGITERIADMRTSRADPMPAILLHISLSKQNEKDPMMFNLVIETAVKIYKKAIQQVTPS